MNSTIEYPLTTPYMWRRMILGVFENHVSKNNPSSYFENQFLIRNDVHTDKIYFYKLCKTNMQELRDVFCEILKKGSQGSIDQEIKKQISDCEFIFGYPESDEFAMFYRDKIPLIQIDDFDEIINKLDFSIRYGNGETLLKQTGAQNQKSFFYRKYTIDPSSLKFFYQELIRLGMIHKDTKPRDFESVFSGNEINKQVIWTGAKSDLYYLIKRLNELNVVENSREKWKIAVHCFVQKDMSKFERRNLSTQKKPEKTYKKIDSLIESLC